MICKRPSAWKKPKSKPQRPTSEYASGKIKNLINTKIVDYSKTGKAGLENLGNSCYINCVLQCLSNTQPFSDFFISGLFKEELDEQFTNGEFSNAINQFLEAEWLDEFETIMPTGVCSLTWGQKSFSKGLESDCYEFFSFLLDEIHSELNRCRVLGKPLTEFVEDNQDFVSLLMWKEHLAYNSSIIVDLFHGQFRSTIKCLSCNFQSTNFEVFSSLSLPISSTNPCTLLDCFSMLSKSERLSSSEMWKCFRCGEKQRGIKKLDLYKIPPILALCLKRFSSEGVNETCVNVPKKISLSTLTGGRLRDIYKLYAVINYTGSGQNGHYYADILNYKDKTWNRFNDNSVEGIDFDNIDGEKVYMLFFTSSKEEFCTWNSQRVTEEIHTLQSELSRKNSQVDYHLHGSTNYSITN